MTDNKKLSVSELANSPREVSIGDIKLKLRQLSIKEMFGHFEQKIKNQKIVEAQEMASIMDSDTRKDFLLDVWKNLPTGSDLTDKVTDTMASVDGIYDIIYLASKDLNDVSEEIIKDNIKFENLGELTPVINWIAGMENIELSVEESEESEEGAEKKTV